MDTCSHYENVTDDQKPKRLKLDIYLKQVTKKCDVKRCTEEGKRLQDFGDGDLNLPRNFDVALSGELLTLLDAFAVLVVAELLPTPDFVQLGHLESLNRKYLRLKTQISETAELELLKESSRASRSSRFLLTNKPCFVFLGCF